MVDSLPYYAKSDWAEKVVTDKHASFWTNKVKLTTYCVVYQETNTQHDYPMESNRQFNNTQHDSKMSADCIENVMLSRNGKCR